MGTHPIFESDFDCLTEWVDLDHVRARKNQKKKIEEEIEADHEKKKEKDHVTETESDETEEDQDQETEKDDEAETEKMKKQVSQEKIQSAGLKLQPNHGSHLIEKLLLEKS